MSLYSKLRGTAETLFQLGFGGPQWKNVSGPPVAIEARDTSDAAYVIVRGADPNSGIGAGSNNELVTQKSVQQNFHRSFLLMGA